MPSGVAGGGGGRSSTSMSEGGSGGGGGLLPAIRGSSHKRDALATRARDRVFRFVEQVANETLHGALVSLSLSLSFCACMWVFREHGEQQRHAMRHWPRRSRRCSLWSRWPRATISVPLSVCLSVGLLVS